MHNIETIKTEIVNRLISINPEMVILFGSYVNGTPNEDSDIDLYVVTNDNFMPQNYEEKMNVYLKVSRQLNSLMEDVPTDLIVHTKKMYKKFIELNSFFSREIMQSGISLI